MQGQGRGGGGGKGSSRMRALVCDTHPRIAVALPQQQQPKAVLSGQARCSRDLALNKPRHARTRRLMPNTRFLGGEYCQVKL